MSALITRALTDRRVNDYCVWTDHRQSERRVSPAIGEFAIGEAYRLKGINKELLAALQHFVTVCEKAPPIHLIRLINESCQQARAAIAKATS